MAQEALRVNDLASALEGYAVAGKLNEAVIAEVKNRMVKLRESGTQEDLKKIAQCVEVLKKLKGGSEPQAKPNDALS